MRFSNNVVLVAGGTGGLGRAVSLGFLNEGARVVVTYRSRDEFSAMQSAAGAEALLDGREIDATDETSVGRLIESILAQYGRLDALVNAIGAYAGGAKLWEGNTKVFDQMLALNLRAGVLLCRAVVPSMLRKGSGAIVNVASKAAIDHAAGNAAYAASKAAALAMTDSLADELKGTGVRVNSILPSIIDTEANRKGMPNADFTKWPKPEDIARVILFLCSDDAKVIHGAAIPVYGNT
ncbi:MAG TPA: SDR family NAD(P)-dependent oxidoreductase [Bryobacteraceae bacterium]|jgi:NAD(P)-dependent dehydrogenase (short-subunit alcohol dehydrogenase family)|nr:SDR family NAD(P)-dependent oxidoreductase [Bryobacteraceae bacterium]